MKIRFLGTHNTESKRSKLVTFLVDGVLAVEAATLTSELTFAEQARIRAILVTHGHYDHIKALPAFAFANSSRVTKVFGTPDTLQMFQSHMADGLIYPDFSSDVSSLAKRVLDLNPVAPLQPVKIAGYDVLPVSMPHSISAAGFEIVKGGKRIFYSGDTGSGLAAVWQQISPQVLIIELTLPNRLRNAARDSGHLCAEMLKQELLQFQAVKGYLPRVNLVHMTPRYEEEIAGEVKDVRESLTVSIQLTAEGDELTV